MTDSRDTNGKNFSRHFDSFGALLDWIQATPKVWRNNSASTDGGSYSFYGSSDYPEADGYARNGWKEGREKLGSSLKDAAKAVSIQSPPSQWYDVAGAYPNVPMAVSGEIECMVNLGDVQRAQRPVIRFLINGSASAMVSKETIMTRGAAILSWIDALETNGFRCEIEMCFPLQERGGVKSNCCFILKRAEEALEIDRCAYVLIHPSMLRRHMLAFVERMTLAHESAWGSSYGTPGEISPEPNQIYFGMSHGDQKQWASPAKAAAYIKAQIEAGGVNLEDAGEE